MLKVENVMTRDVRGCTPGDTLDHAAQVMWEHDCGCVPVTMGGDGTAPVLAGMLTDRDVCMAAYTQGKPLHAIEIGSVMARAVATCKPSDTVASALKIMRTRQLRRLPVVDAEDHLVGMLSLADMAREGQHERGWKRKGVSDRSIGETIAAIVRPRGGGRELATAVGRRG